MAEANKAYADGDEEQLRMILHRWQRSPDAVHGSDSAAARLRLVRRIAQLEEQLTAFQLELDELKASTAGAAESEMTRRTRTARTLSPTVARLEARHHRRGKPAVGDSAARLADVRADELGERQRCPCSPFPA